MTINCHVPLRLKLVGEPSEDDWARLEETLVAQYARALRQGIETINRAGLVGTQIAVRERYDQARDTSEGYLIPSYQNGQPAPVPTDPLPAGMASSPVTVAQATAMIRDRFPETDGLPSSESSYYGVYVTLQEGNGLQAGLQLVYLLADGRLSALRLSMTTRDGEALITLDPGSYTLLHRSGEEWGGLYRRGRLMLRMKNRNDLNLAVTFFVPEVAGGATEQVEIRHPYTFFPQVEMVPLFSDPELATGTEAVWVAHVTIWRRDANDNWLPLYPLALLYASLYYTWEVWKVVPAPGGTGQRRRIKLRETTPSPRAGFFHFTFTEDGDYEIACSVTLHDREASPYAVHDSRREHVVKLEVKQAVLLAQLEKQEETKTRPGDVRTWAQSVQELLDQFTARLEAEKDEGRRKVIQEAIDKLKHHLVGQTAAGPFPIHAIFTERRTSLTRPLSLFLGPAAKVETPNKVTWLLTDVTFPAFYATYPGTGDTVGEAIRAAFNTARTSFQNKYPPGQILAHIAWEGMEQYGLKPWDFSIETESWQREAYEWLSAGVQVLGAITLAASVVFPPSAILTGAIVVTMAAGATVSAINIASRINAGNFAWDASAISDVVNIAASLTFVGRAAAGAAAARLSRTLATAQELSLAEAAKLAGTVASLQRFQRAALLVGLAGDASNGIILSWDTYEQLRGVDSAMNEGSLADYQRIYGVEQGRQRWEGERYARILAILARAAVGGLLIGLSAKAGAQGLAESQTSAAAAAAETERLKAARQAMEATPSWIGQHGGGTEAAAITTAKQAGEQVFDLNNIPKFANAKNFPLLDISTNRGLQSVKAKAVDSPYGTNTVRAYRAEFQKLVDNGPQELRMQRQAAQELVDARKQLQAAGAWPQDLGTDPSLEQVVDYVHNKAELVIPSNHVDDVRKLIRSDAAQFPENYGLNPKSPNLQAEIEGLANRVKPAGLTSQQLQAIQTDVRSAAASK